MITYKTIVNACKAFADNHHIIKGFGNGELWQINDHDQDSAFEYPLHYMVDVPSSPGPKSWVYAFRVYFVSRVEAPKDRDGNPIYFEYTSEKSSMIACAQDFLSYWVQDVNYKLTIEQSLGVTTFIDAQQDGVTGCYVDIRFVVPFDYNNCILPMDDVPAPRLLCLPVSLSLDNNVIASIASGDSYNITLKDIDGNPVVWSYNEPLKILTIQLGACDPVTMTYNGVSITSTDAGGTKTITVLSESLDPVGTITVDTSGQLTVIIANATIVNQSPGATWTDTVYASGSYILQAQPWTDSDGSAQSTPYNPDVPIVCTPNSGSGINQIGYIVNDDFSTVANLTNYDLVSTGSVAYNLDGGYLKISGTPASISPITTFAKYKHSIALEKYGVKFRVVVKSETPGANESVVWGIEADIVSGMPPGSVRKELFYWYRNPSAPTITGKIYRAVDNTTGVQFVTTAVAPVIDHEYEILTFLMFNMLMVTIKDVTPGFENEQGATVSFTYANTTGNLTPRSSRLFIGTGGGEHWYKSFQIVSTDLKGGKHIVIHDSLGDGYCTDHFIQRWLDIHKANKPDLVIMKSGRQGDWPSSALLRMDEFALLKGTNTTVHLHIGTNQVVTSGPGPAFTSYQQLINGLIALGYTTFVHYYAFPRGGFTSINTYNASILSTYGALAGHTVVDTNTPFNNGSNSLLPQYAATDNIHLNAGAGQRKMAELTSPYFV